jgi:hypothetical protein
MRASGPKNLKTYYFSTCNYLLRYLIAEGPPEKIAETEGSYTGFFLRKVLNHSSHF